MEDCIFCKIVSGELPSEKVFESDDFVVIKDVNPKVEGHMLVISKEHFADFMEMPSGLYEGMLKSARDVVKKLGVEDFNLVVNNGKAAGQIVGHFHMHVLPRTEGDGFGIGV